MRGNNGLSSAASQSSQPTLELPRTGAGLLIEALELWVGESLYLALKATVEGTQEYGKREMLGLKDGAVGISKNAQYEKLVPADLRAEVDAIEAKIVSGEIAVDTDMD